MRIIVLARLTRLARPHGRHRATRRNAARAYHPSVRPLAVESAAFAADADQALALVADAAERCRCCGHQQCTARRPAGALSAEFERLVTDLATPRAERLHAALGKVGGTR